MLLTVFVISLIVSFTSIGFPYSDNKTDPRLQRHRVTHIKRTAYNADGSVNFTDIGYLISIIDRNSERNLKADIFRDDYDTKLTSWLDDSHCSEIANCGFTLTNIFVPYAKTVKYLRSSVAPNVLPTGFRIGSNTWNAASTEVTVNFKAHFSGYTQVYLSIEQGWECVNSSIFFADTDFMGRIYKNAKIHVGIVPSSYSDEFITFKKTDSNAPVKAATFTLINNDFIFNKTDEFTQLLARFPSYVNIFERQADSSTYEIQIK